MLENNSLGFIFLVCVFATKFADPYPNINKQNFTLDNKTNESVYITHISQTQMGPNQHLFFIPFAKSYKNSENIKPCNKTDEGNFPKFLSDDQLLKGGIILVILIGLYGFTLLAVVCNDYFLPCVETICERLNLSPDVAAATFMSIATSTPEFFTNLIGTFITESDLGIGTIVGSSMFNCLGVPAIGGLAAPVALQLDWYPVTRDCIIYIISVSILILITWDGFIYWFETTISLGVYITYFIIMYNNKRIEQYVKHSFNKEKIDTPPEDSKPGNSVDIKKLSKNLHLDEIPRGSILSAYGTYLEDARKSSYDIDHIKVLESIQEEEKKEALKSLFRRPEGKWYRKFIFYYTWPLKLVLKYTVPNPKVSPNWYPLTFIMCIVWIGGNSYLVSFMIGIIGAITKLPDALLGMTIMAVGACLPETVSMAILARRGEGGFGVSNSLGANTMNVLYSLGLPWLLKNLVNLSSSKRPIKIQSGSLEYTIISLFFAVISLFLILLFNKFRLSKLSGSILGCFYLTLVAIAILTQTVFFKESKNCP